MNKVFLVGRLVRNPIEKYINNDKICTFSIAVNRISDQKPDFFAVTVWGKQAETCLTYLEQGSKVLISGTLKINNYETAQNIKKMSIEITADDVTFLSRKKATKGEAVQ